MTGVGDLFRRAFTENLGMKLFALVAAIAIFSVVRAPEDGQNSQRSVFVPLVALLPDTGKVLVSELPDRIRVTLTGSGRLLNTFRLDELEPIQIDLKGGDESYYYLDSSFLSLPVGISVAQMVPASIPLRWSEQVQRRISVVAQMTGQPAHGMVATESPLVDPPAVIVRGAQSEIEAMTQVLTEPIDVGELKQGTHPRTVALASLPPHATYLGRGEVNVLVEIVSQIQERRLTGLTVELVGPGGRVRPATVDVLLAGPAGVVEQLDAERIVPWVDASDPGLSGTMPLGVQVRGVPDGVELVAVDPAEALVSISN